MAAILSAEHLSKSYTLKKLLTDVTIYIGEHDRIGVVGVNGTGKSTLLKLLAGMEEPDGGVVMRKNGPRVSYLPQMPDYSVARTAVQQVLYDAPKDVGAPDEYEAKSLLSQFGISDFDADVRTLSGGQKKRIALAAALIRPVDLLLLDEPTNHIDAETIALLESRLAKCRGTLMMVTHDRYFSTVCATASRKSAKASCICTTAIFPIIWNRRLRGWRWKTRRRKRSRS
ncbi:MAG: ATP-binding cassette domain-containing protein [Christensenellales bacterium]